MRPRVVWAGGRATQVTMADVDLALSHQFMVQFRLGMFDPDDMQP